MKIPKNVNIAFSGGVDSLAIAHFLKRGKHHVTLLHFNHGCEYSNQIEQECRELAEQLDLPIIVGYMGDATKPPKQSLEEWWRKSRYAFLRSYTSDPIVTGHHLNDAVETWVFTSMNGYGRIIPVENNGIIRPFLLTTKDQFQDYADRYNLKAVDDPFNEDYSLTRNYIRHTMMPHVKFINPGIDKVIRKKYLKLLQEQTNV